ncbi:hypothetical protein ACM66B_002930 [Microbotryomycetes sp. NB124-2]
MKWTGNTIAAAVLTALAFGGAVAQSQCNGYSEFCSRQYSKVSVIGAHNSYAVSPGNIAANQNYTVTTQLDNGVRMLQVQGHMNDGELHLCHTSCLLLDAGKFSDYLSQVKSWLDDNKNEVVTILMVNNDGIDASVWQQAYSDSGLNSYAYQPTSVPVAYDSWPTLQELIDSGKRVVSFLAQGADMSTAPYLLDEFTHIWETPFSQTDPSFPCTVDRVTGDYQGKMYLINHNLNVNKTLLGQTIPVPAVNELNQTNAATGTGSLGAQADACESDWGYKPTFTLVDYYDVGDGSVFEYAATVNGVSYNAVEIGNGTAGQSDGTTRSAGGAVESRPLGAASGLETRTLFELAALCVVVTCSSSSKAVHDLCSSVDGARLAPLKLVESSSTTRHKPSFRRPTTLSTHPLSTTLLAGSQLEQADAEFASFRSSSSMSPAPRSQIEALPPPLATFSSQIPARDPTSLSASGFKTFQARNQPQLPTPWAAHELQAPPSTDETASAYWNPEQETLHFLSASSTSSSSISSCSSSPQRSSRTRRTTTSSFDLPSSDEAASYLSCATTVNGSSSSCEDDYHASPTFDYANITTASSSTSCSRERRAHPLTMQPNFESAWDFDRLFSKKRTWFGGAKKFGDEQHDAQEDDELGSEADNEGDGNKLGGERGRSMIKGKTKYRKSLLRNEVVPSTSAADSTVQPTIVAATASLEPVKEHLQPDEQDRQQQVLNTMRKAAMERLALLGAHLAWSGGVNSK